MVMRHVLVLLLFLLSAGLHADDSPHYSVGVVPQFSPQVIAEVWQPILREVSQLAGVELDFVAAPSIPEFERGFVEGRYDFAYMNPYHLLVAHRAQGYLPLLKDVDGQLRGIIVVRRDSPLHSVVELAGKRVAFPAPNALGAALLPRAEFARKFHIKVDELYANSHSSVYLNVATGVADAGGGVARTLASQPANIRRRLRVLYQTEALPSHPIAVHPRVDRAIRERVSHAFLQLAATEHGRELLARIPIKRLGRAHLEEYRRMEALGLDEFYVKVQ